MLLKKMVAIFTVISLLINNMSFAISIETSEIESITIKRDYTIEKRKAVGGKTIFDSVSSADLGEVEEDLETVWVKVRVKEVDDITEAKGIYIVGEENSVFANPAQNNFFVEGEIRLIKGKNTIEIIAALEDDSTEEYEIIITVGEDESNDGSRRRRHTPALAAQGARIISTDVGSAFLTYENESNIVMDEKYKEEIIAKANRLRNFTVNTYESKAPGSVEFTKELLEELKKDSNITEIQVETLLGSVKIRLTDLLGKGDIRIFITKADELTDRQKSFIGVNEMYNIDIFAILNSVTTKLNKFAHNIETVLPYKIANEDPLTITMYSGKEDGNAENLRGTYDAENVYAFVKEIADPIIGLPNIARFDDIEGYGWARDFIKECASKNIICGRGEHIYSPADNITRAEFIALLMRVAGIEPIDSDNAVFTDVSKDSWCYQYVMTAKELDLVKGTSDITFSPDADIKREDMAVMIKNLLEYMVGKFEIADENDFSDSNEVSAYAKEAVDLMRHLEVIEGYEDTTFKPNILANRAEAATMITRLFKLINRFYIEELLVM